LIDNKASKKRYRADVLVEDYMAKIEGKINKEVAKAKKRFKDAFNEAEFRSTHPRVLANQAKIDTISARLGKAMTDGDLADMKALIEE
jgi:glycyl-tRNA synthetase